MSRRVSIALRLRTLAALTALLCAGPLTIVHGRALARATAPGAQEFFDGRAFAATLPVALTPPTLDPGLRFVSMIAADIDADGDLDVVANDGSLDLVVWTNDGTGRLTRKYPSPSTGGHAQPAGPTVDDQQLAGSGAVPAGGWACVVRPLEGPGIALIDPLVAAPAPGRLSSAASVCTPRAPPASPRLI